MENHMFTMSPMPAATDSGAKSVSFDGNHGVRLAAEGTATSGSAMSTDSLASRAPFGDVQNTFEFKPGMQQFGNTKAPFSSVQPATSTDSARTPDQRIIRGPMTPGSVVSESRGTAGTEAAPRAPLVWSDVLLWKEPLQTLAIFMLGLVCFSFFTFLLYGAHSMSFVSGVSYLLLADVGTNFFRYFVSKSWHDKCLWGGAAQMKHVLTRINGSLLHLAAAHDKYLSAVDPFITLKVAGALWAAAWIGTFLSLWWCALLAYIGAFTVPAIYQAIKDDMAATAKGIRAATIDKVDAAGLSRTFRFFTVASAVAVLYFFTSWTQFAIGFFVAATYWRTLLAHNEIEMIRTVAEPYTHSVRKVSRRIGAATEDAFARLSTAGPSTRTVSHFRTD